MLDEKTREDLLDALYDLKHDLGKYIRFPLGMLPKDATQDAVRDALKTALHVTRKRGTEAVCAWEIWVEFVAEWEAPMAMFSSYVKLHEAVEQAIELELLLEDPGTIIERESALGCLSRVGEEISNLIDEVETNGK